MRAFLLVVALVVTTPAVSKTDPPAIPALQKMPVADAKKVEPDKPSAVRIQLPPLTPVITPYSANK